MVKDKDGVLVGKKPVREKKKTELAVVNVPEEKSPQSMIELAIEKGANVDALEKLVALQERWEAREAKKAFDRAMSAFQSDCPTITKTKPVNTKDGRVAYRYAPIESIVNQVKSILEKHGFSYSTSMELQEKGVKVAVKVVHEQGHSEVSEMAVPFGTMTAIMSASQQAAAAQTFAKRYAFCNAFGILTGDEDNDGANIETGNKPTDERVPPADKEEESNKVLVGDPLPSNRCNMCPKVITEQVSIYSIRMFGRPLCREHQKLAMQTIK